jgi:hypothetical protein
MGDGDAGERPGIAAAQGGVRLAGGGQGLLGGDGDEGVELGVEALDPVQEWRSAPTGEFPAAEA